MNNMPLQDALERKRALDPTLSFIVQAPAGSGKTELLTQRFLSLLSCVKQPEEILAITFTKKSAAEMRARIIQALQSGKNQSEPITSHAKQTWGLAQNVLKRDQLLKWDLLDNPNRLQIQTIDALNSRLTRQLPLLSHFGAPLEIAADHANALYQEAVYEFLSHLEEKVEWSKAIEKLLIHLDNDLDKVANLLINMLEKRDQWLPYIALNASNPALRKTLEANLSSVIIEALSLLQQVFPKDCVTELVFLAKFAAENLLRAQSSSFIIHCNTLDALPGSEVSHKKQWLGLYELLFTKDGNWRKKFTKNEGIPSPSNAKKAEDKHFLNDIKSRLHNLIDHLSENETVKNAFHVLNILPEPNYPDNQWETLEALHDVLRVAVAQLKIIFQKHSKIDYIENAEAALLALGTEDNPTDLTLALDYKIQHILIDEFQDTSNSQYRLLEKLIAGWQPFDGRTLFVVGDPMQSIYRFREAEVGLFIRARKKGIGHLPLEPLTLSVNFRSVPGVVNWVNKQFAIVFPPIENIANGAVSYSKSIACQEDISNEAVSLHPFFNTNDSAQAESIVKLIQEIKENHPSYTIAVLVRSRTHLKNIIPALKTHHIPFRALDIEPLKTRPIIQDLLVLTRALLYPVDRIAWLALLRAPWCGLLLNDLLIIAGNPSEQIIWQTLQNPLLIEKMSATGQQHLKRILPILANALSERRRYPLRYWIEYTWLQLGGPACVEQKSDLENANAFFKLLEKVDDASDLPNLSLLNKAIDKLYATPNHFADTSLQIMTIHNAKGLEFDVVILPSLERKAANDDKQLLQWIEFARENAPNNLILAPITAANEQSNVIYDYIQDRHHLKTAYENGRLLYVAATRAKKQLHLFFNLETTSEDKIAIKKPAHNSLLQKLWPAIQGTVSTNINNEMITNTVSYSRLNQKQFKRLQTTWQNISIKNKLAETMIFHQEQTDFQLPDNNPRHIGIVTHQILQQLAEYGMAWWLAQSSDVQFNYIKKQLLQLGMHNNYIIAATKDISQAIQNTLQDARGQWILQQFPEAQSEFPLTTATKHMVIDRTFIDEQGTRWIIDYKSSHSFESDLNQFLAAEQKLYEKQLFTYYQAFKKFETRPIRVGLYFPFIPAWHEWTFENFIS